MASVPTPEALDQMNGQGEQPQPPAAKPMHFLKILAVLVLAYLALKATTR